MSRQPAGQLTDPGVPTCPSLSPVAWLSWRLQEVPTSQSPPEGHGRGHGQGSAPPAGSPQEKGHLGPSEWAVPCSLREIASQPAHLWAGSSHVHTRVPQSPWASPHARAPCAPALLPQQGQDPCSQQPSSGLQGRCQDELRRQRRTVIPAAPVLARSPSDPSTAGEPTAPGPLSSSSHATTAGALSSRNINKWPSLIP